MHNVIIRFKHFFIICYYKKIVLNCGLYVLCMYYENRESIYKQTIKNIVKIFRNLQKLVTLCAMFDEKRPMCA